MRTMTLARQKMRGAAVVAAIFLMVILAALGAYMLNFTNVQQSTSMLDVEGTRAYWAARSGIDWGMYQALTSTTTYGCKCNSGCTGGATATNTTNITVGTFTVTVACNCVPVCEAGNPEQIYKLIATACNQPSGGACPNTAPTSVNYVSRRASAVLKN